MLLLSTLHGGYFYLQGFVTALNSINVNSFDEFKWFIEDNFMILILMLPLAHITCNLFVFESILRKPSHI